MITPLSQRVTGICRNVVVESSCGVQIGVSTFLGSPSCNELNDNEGVDEVEMWKCFKAYGFYRNLWACMTYFSPLPLRDWLKMLLLIPRTMQLVDLQKMCDEEDTSTLAVSVTSPRPVSS